MNEAEHLVAEDYFTTDGQDGTKAMNLVHVSFFDELRRILVTDDFERFNGLIAAFKNEEETAQFAINTMQELLDVQLRRGLDWKVPSVTRTRLCRLLGTFASECKLISLPTGFIITGIVKDLNEPQNAGSCGIVSFARWQPRGEMVAVKEARLKHNGWWMDDQAGSRHVQMLLYELMLWRNLSHRCITELKGVTISGQDGCYSLVLQYFLHRSLKICLSGTTMSSSSIDARRKHVRRWMLDIAEGLLYLHLQGYVHGDIRGVSKFLAS
ncbi:kinase-like domain-containing protein [Abortiporus biennis]|nr:kinase-like domain-containing protein [Abortiporus biennis]